MLTTLQETHKVLQESLRFCLYPRAIVKLFGAYGLDLTRRLLDSGTFLHLFSAVDIVCSFFSIMIPLPPRLPTLPVSQEWRHFRTLYLEYPRYIESLFEGAFFRMVAADAHRLIGYEQLRQAENELLLYKTFSFVIAELALECPFIELDPPFDPRILSAIRWDFMVVPERRPFEPREEQILLASLGFENPSVAKAEKENDVRKEAGKSESTSVSSNGGAADPRTEVLFGTVFQWYHERRNNGVLKGMAEQDIQGANSAAQDILVDIARLPYVLDYKLIDSYLDYHDKFELDEELRHKISFLKQISRISIEKSPFITEYSMQWTSGIPNPAFLTQGWKIFMLKMIEGAPVFLGKPDPLYDQDTVAIRFYFIEDLRTLCEKILDTEARPRFSHLNVHELTALLVAHDIVKYLGAISKMEMSLEFIKYGEGTGNRTRSTGALHTRTIREKVALDEGFMVRNRSVEKVLLIEPGKMGLQASKFDEDFFKKFFEELDSRLTGSSNNARIYDFYFGPGGTFMKETGTPIVAAENESPTISQQEFSPSSGLAGLLEKRLFRMLPNHSRGFACETNSRYVLAVGSEAGVLKSAVIEHSLVPFLDSVRRFVLNLVTDEAIRFRLGYIERMKR
jgi:hypothetical protein